MAWCLCKPAWPLQVPALSYNLNALPGSSATLVYYLTDIPQDQASYTCHVAPIFRHFPISEVNQYPQRPDGSHLHLASSDLETLKARHLCASSPLRRQCRATARVPRIAIALCLSISTGASMSDEPRSLKPDAPTPTQSRPSLSRPSRILCTQQPARYTRGRSSRHCTE